MLVTSLVQTLGLICGVCLQVSSPGPRIPVEIYVRSNSFGASAAPALARAGAKPVAVVDAGADPTGRGFASATPQEICNAVRRIYGAKPPEFALVDLPWQAIGNGLATSDPASPRMISVIQRLKQEFPGTRWSWRGIPNLPVGNGTEPPSLVDQQTANTATRWQALAAECDWLNPDPTLGGQLPRPTDLERWMARSSDICAQIANGKKVIPAITQWVASGGPKGVTYRIGVPPSGLTANVRSLRVAGADAVVLAEPRGIPRPTVQLASLSLVATTQSIRAADAAWLRTATPATRAASPTPAAPVPATGAGIAAAPVPPAAPIAQTADAGIARSTVESAERALTAIGPRPLPTADLALRFEPTNWDAVYDLAANSAELREMLLGLNSMADKIATTHGRDRYVRPQTYDRVAPDMLDPALRTLQPVARRDLSQLAIVDTAQTNYLRTNGVILAVVAKRTRNADYLSKCIDMLESINAYMPLQRPGYTYSTPSIPMTEDGDGVWLATAWGIDAIIEMMSVLGNDVPQELQARLRKQLRDEVNRITIDWADRRPWFVKSRSYQSNQWLEPNIALVKACLFLRDPGLRPAYELGAQNIALSLERLGSDGSFNEGVSYAEMTVGRLHEVLECMRRAGDNRCAASGFARNNWRWFAQMLMPGRMLVNSYDSGMSRLPTAYVEAPLSGFGAAALATDDPGALSTLRYLFPRIRGNYSISAIRLAAALATSQTAPALAIPPYEYFPDQQQLVWRSTFQGPSAQQTALGLWARGGSQRDNHCHRDQGQVSVYKGDRAVLIDCGTSEYRTAEYAEFYSAAAGHSTFQFGALRPNGAPVSAPITVRSLGPEGGDISIDCTAAYPSADSYVRGVTWNAAGDLRIDDRVSLRAPVPTGSELFRFHTGSPAPLQIEGSGRSWTISWEGTEMTLASTSDIEVMQSCLPDRVTATQSHMAIIVRGTEATASVGLVTTLRVR